MIERIENIEQAITLLTQLNAAADTRNELMSEFIKQTDIRLRGLDNRQAAQAGAFEELTQFVKASEERTEKRFALMAETIEASQQRTEATFARMSEGIDALQKLQQQTEVRFNQFMNTSETIHQTLNALLASQAGLNSKLDILITRLDTWIESLASRNGG
jgi:chromosome condensin MukBEF ATPase and DNA-binding subunit MukB